MPDCIQCGDVWPRGRMLTLDGWLDPPENPDLVCLRCASVAMKGGPESMTQEEREAHNVVINDA